MQRNPHQYVSLENRPSILFTELAISNGEVFGKFL